MPTAGSASGGSDKPVGLPSSLDKPTGFEYIEGLLADS